MWYHGDLAWALCRARQAGGEPWRRRRTPVRRTNRVALATGPAAARWAR